MIFNILSSDPGEHFIVGLLKDSTKLHAIRCVPYLVTSYNSHTRLSNGDTMNLCILYPAGSYL